MVKIIKRVAEGERMASQGVRVMFGEVTSISPLIVRVDNRFDISESMVVLMKEFKAGSYPTHYHSLVRPESLTLPGGQETHLHELATDYLTNEGEGSEIYYGLSVGDKLVLLRNDGGQQFVVLGRL